MPLSPEATKFYTQVCPEVLEDIEDQNTSGAERLHQMTLDTIPLITDVNGELSITKLAFLLSTAMTTADHALHIGQQAYSLAELAGDELFGDGK